MDRNKQQEEFSRAYLLAVVAQAGCNYSIASVDQDSVDLTIRMNSIHACKRTRACLDIQIKSTMQKVIKSDGKIHFPLPIKNYKELITTEILFPRILVVVLVPENIDMWIHQTDEELALRRCAYWISLYGMQDTENSETVTIQIPQSNIFSTNFIKAAMIKIANGEEL